MYADGSPVPSDKIILSPFKFADVQGSKSYQTSRKKKWTMTFSIVEDVSAEKLAYDTGEAPFVGKISAFVYRVYVPRQRLDKGKARRER